VAPNGTLGVSAGFVAMGRMSACAEADVGSTGDGECPYGHYHDGYYEPVDECKPVGGPRWTVVPPTAYAR